MATTQDLQLNINANASGAEGSVKSLKAQLREAIADVQTLSDKFGASSQQAVEAAKKAAELRDRIGDAKEMTDAFNPDAKFKAFSKSLSAVAGGFGAVQGAMALFGNESEDVTKTLLKVQSAMALSQGLQAVGEGIDSFKILGTVIKTQVIGSLKALKIAIGETGIGLLVILIGTTIAALYEWKKSTEEAKEAQDALNESIKNQQINLELNLKQLDRSHKYRLEKLKSQGATETELAAQERKNQLETIALLEDDYRKKYLRYEDAQNKYKKAIKDNEDEDDIKKLKTKFDDENKITNDANERLSDLRVQLRISNLQEKDRIRKEDIDKQIEKLEYETKLELEAEIKKGELLKEIRDKIRNVSIISFKETKQDELDVKNQLEKDADERATALTESGIGKRAALLVQSMDYANMLAADFRRAELDAERQLQDDKYNIALTGLDLISTLADKNEGLANLLFAITKALEIGKIIASTASSIAIVRGNMALIPPILPPGIPNPAYIPAQALGATTIASLKIGAGIQIGSIVGASISKFKNGGGGGASIPSVGVSAPTMPQLPQTSTTNISQQSINDIGNQAVRAYVIENDVTSNQQRIEAIRQRARFS